MLAKAFPAHETAHISFPRHCLYSAQNFSLWPVVANDFSALESGKTFPLSSLLAQLSSAFRAPESDVKSFPRSFPWWQKIRCS